MNTMTAGEARKILETAKYSLRGQAKGNINLTKQQAWDVFWAAVADKPDWEPLNRVVAKNISKEFGR